MKKFWNWMMSPVAMIMVHDPMTIAMGNARAMEKAITTLNEVKESIDEVIVTAQQRRALRSGGRVV